MALDQPALLELLAQLKLTDVSDRIRSATEQLYQQLIDAEAATFIGAAPFGSLVGSSSSSTTSGKPAIAATSPRPPWPPSAPSNRPTAASWRRWLSSPNSTLHNQTEPTARCRETPPHSGT
jgi:hypothetical protein